MQGPQPSAGSSSSNPPIFPISGPTYSQTTNGSDEESQASPTTPTCCNPGAWTFLTDTLPRQLYICSLLRLPALYCSRVEPLSRDANMVLKELLNKAVEASSRGEKDFQTQMSECGLDPSYDTFATSLPPAYQRLANRWGIFIENLMREWKTMNIVSGLLVSGILSIFQTNGASNDPVTRHLAFWSLLSALLSLLYGCSLIVQFSRMRKPSIIIEWVFEAQNPQSIVWSVWVMLALPVIWLAWSIVAFIVCIMTFMWRSGAVPPDVFVAPPSTQLAFQIFVSCVLGIGVIYGILTIMTFRRYGARMDDALRRRIDAYVISASGPRPSDPSVTLNSGRATRPSSPKLRLKRRRQSTKSRSDSLLPTSRATSTLQSLVPEPPQNFRPPPPSNPPHPESSPNLPPHLQPPTLPPLTAQDPESRLNKGAPRQSEDRGMLPPRIPVHNSQPVAHGHAPNIGVPEGPSTVTGPLPDANPSSVPRSSSLRKKPRLRSQSDALQSGHHVT
ncbi:hypothetical protein P691DRAFT_805229 [Macrolepiota fuliginosa MF-IS2]|uniref:Uncharacterized protein n=1 Tax=Macrolepiota fuliginosa MF-IS2 TaxID=1400762 RepID=A0A9P5X8Q0_9AGAR|nr:hypothetical protein P691DRAFT_805229 [Macrolepiota fuliginosa MF-IS2]